jgi:hypothetical protein
VTPFATVDESRDRLHRAGWSIGDAGLCFGAGVVWQVSGTVGFHQLRAEGHTQAEAWHRACELAKAAGLLDNQDRPTAPSPPRS